MAKDMTNKEVADVFTRLADMLEIKGEVIYKIIAYRRAAENISREPRDIAILLRDQQLRTISGVGEAIEKKIVEILSTGHLRLLDETAAEIPDELLTLLDVPGVGPRTAKLLYEKLGITNVAGLEDAARKQLIRSLPGQGAKSEESILHGIEMLNRRSTRHALGDVLPIAEEMLRSLRLCPQASKVSAAGSLRRRKPTIGDLDFLAASETPQAVIAYFLALAQVGDVVSHGDVKATVILNNGVQADLMVLPPEQYGSLLQHFTGSKEHNVHLRQIALDKGLSFSEKGFQKADGSLILCPEETDVYQALGLPWIPPELREDSGEFEAAKKNKLPRLVEVSDMTGDLHAHSQWSDGVASIAEMAAAAQALGYQYIAISDHSHSLGITHGLTAQRIVERQREIDAVNAQVAPFRVFSGVEVDIMADGSLALPDDVLATLDVVVASPHTALRQSSEVMTERLLKAIRNPHVDVIGHPTGVLIGDREPAQMDFTTIVVEAAQHGVALEINANPARLDLDDVHARQAVAAGALLCIDTDAHRTEMLKHMVFGVAMARRGWCEAGHILNTRSLADVQAWLARRRG